MEVTRTFAGIDWSWQHHAICVVDDAGARVEDVTVTHSKAGLAKIAALLNRLGTRRVGIERGDGPVVEHLLRHGFEVVVISSRQVRSLRARYGSAGNKDDRFDAFVLADALRTDAGRWALVQPDTAETIALRMLVRARHDLIDHRVAVHNQLLAVLQHNFPGAIGLFSQLDIAVSLAFLRRFPSEAKAAWLSENRMAHWLRANGYCGRQTSAELITHLRQAVTGRVSGPAAEASELIVIALVDLLTQAARAAGRARGPDQRSAPGPPRRPDLPVLPPRRHHPGGHTARRDRRLPGTVPRRPGTRRGRRRRPLDPTVRQIPERHLPPQLQQATARRARRLGTRHPTRQRMGRRHLPKSPRPRLPPPTRSKDPRPSMDKDPLALLARPHALQPRPTRATQHPAARGGLT